MPPTENTTIGTYSTSIQVTGGDLGEQTRDSVRDLLAVHSPPAFDGLGDCDTTAK